MGLASASEPQVSSERSAKCVDPAAQPGRMSIRLATEEADIRAMHAEGRFKKFFYDEARLLAAGKGALKHCNPGIILVERIGSPPGDRLVGMTIAMTSLHLLFVRKDARHGRAGVMLLAALRQWAKAAGAVELNLSTTMGVDILRRMGFCQTGGNYVLEGLG